eukprot:CAMPEP_0195286336 /NCGR_PEP_ID=MMETSP0707-20130614/3836_1 /TAXON_ID=33640 /ORGANISM="Asterionellopsis glacialis, Strain CCMP134" /LENGTH=1234 /DNA_ID=CAMNT_0040345969 /DNA_START=389 /DNA_END=4093 /DNA_ORIENTATION=-
MCEPIDAIAESGGKQRSPFGHLKPSTQSSPGCIRAGIWRTQSLDEGKQNQSNSDEDEVSFHGADTSGCVAALHQSFDAALLESCRNENSNSSHEKQGEYSSWDEYDSNVVHESTLGAELSGKKHLRQQAMAEPAEMIHPGTVRKLPRRSSTTKTPTQKRSVFPLSSTVKKSGQSATPGSTNHRRAQHRVPLARKSGSSSTQRPRSSQQQQHNATLTPTRPRSGLPPNTALKASTRTQVTLETTTTETDSHGTNSPVTTPFRFTSFPASLPRVNNLRTGSPFDGNRPADSVRKRMVFADVDSQVARGEEAFGEASDDTSMAGTRRAVVNQPLHLLASTSRDDECTQNTSISSMSQDGHQQHMPSVAGAPSVPPTVLEWTDPVEVDVDVSFHNNDKNDTITTEHEEEQDNRRPDPVHTKLFTEEDDIYDYSDDNSTNGTSPLGMGRTRLNFNLVLSPNRGVDDGEESNEDGDHHMMCNNYPATVEKPRDVSSQKMRPRKNSFPHADVTPLRSCPDATPMGNMSGGSDEVATASTTAFTPSRSGLASGTMISRLDTSEGERTPDEVQIHFHVDAAQCSPILGIPEEDEAVNRHLLQPRRSMDMGSKDEKMSMLPPQAPVHHSESDKSVSHESGASSSTSSSKLRKLRPMPDVSAFEIGTRSVASSKHDKSSDESSSGVDSRAPPSPKLLCPPTPVRTPAWAHNDNGTTPHFARANSLIVTKVLATCPPQVLDGHSSLESSLFEEENSSISATLDYRRASLSFGTVDEEMEDSASGQEKSSSTDVAYPVSGIENNMPISEDSRRALHSDSSKTGPPTQSISVDSSYEQPKLKRNRLSSGNSGSQKTISVISFASDFENLGLLGRGAFADVYKVRSKIDNQMYAIKRNRLRFRGKRDRDMALAEVRTMQKLQSVCASETGTSSSTAAIRSNEKSKNSYSLYLLFFFRAWQEEGYFHSQTELCCRDTCREMMESLRSQWPVAKRRYPSLSLNLPPLSDTAAGNDDDHVGRIVPTMTVWKICHDVLAGLSHIHSHNMVHHDIKPSNIFFVQHHRLGAMCKIGDFGMAGDVGTMEDGQEGDTIYMPLELLSSGRRHPSADIFSLGLTLYELSSSSCIDLPSEGSRWHELRSGEHIPELPQCRSAELGKLIQAMISPDLSNRPTADKILDGVPAVKEAGTKIDEFLRDYINDIEVFDHDQDRRESGAGITPRNPNRNSEIDRSLNVRTPTPDAGQLLFTPEPK